MRKKSKIAALLMAAVMLFAFAVPVVASSVEDIYPAFEGTMILDCGREVRSLQYGLANGQVHIVGEGTNARVASVALPTTATIVFGDTAVELNFGDALLNEIDANEFEYAVANGRAIQLTEEMVANGYVTFADSAETTEDMYGRSLTCQFLGFCQVVPIGTAVIGGVIIVIFECVLCGAWFF